MFICILLCTFLSGLILVDKRKESGKRVHELLDTRQASLKTLEISPNQVWFSYRWMTLGGGFENVMRVVAHYYMRHSLLGVMYMANDTTLGSGKIYGYDVQVGVTGHCDKVRGGRKNSRLEACREVWEETGLDIDPRQLRFISFNTNKKGETTTTFLLDLTAEPSTPPASTGAQLTDVLQSVFVQVIIVGDHERLKRHAIEHASTAPITDRIIGLTVIPVAELITPEGVMTLNVRKHSDQITSHLK